MRAGFKKRVVRIAALETIQSFKFGFDYIDRLTDDYSPEFDVFKTIMWQQNGHNSLIRLVLLEFLCSLYALMSSKTSYYRKRKEIRQEQIAQFVEENRHVFTQPDLQDDMNGEDIEMDEFNAGYEVRINHQKQKNK